MANARAALARTLFNATGGASNVGTPISTDQSTWSSQSGGSLRTAGNVAKLDIKKLVKPRKTGWRFMALDFIMPNHQIVEVSELLIILFCLEH